MELLTMKEAMVKLNEQLSNAKDKEFGVFVRVYSNGMEQSFITSTEEVFFEEKEIIFYEGMMRCEIEFDERGTYRWNESEKGLVYIAPYRMFTASIIFSEN